MNYKEKAFNAIIAALLAWSSTTAIAQPKNEEPDTFTLKTNEKFCDQDETQLVKKINSAKSLILSCECNCTAQENRIWIINSEKKSIYEIEASKAVSTKEINNTDSIPDIFGRVPFCEKKTPTNSSITILTKQPSAGSTSPYCYSKEPFIEPDNKKCNTKECKNILYNLTKQHP